LTLELLPVLSVTVSPLGLDKELAVRADTEGHSEWRGVRMDRGAVWSPTVERAWATALSHFHK
jgi:hypothetical protein